MLRNARQAISGEAVVRVAVRRSNESEAPSGESKGTGRVLVMDDERLAYGSICGYSNSDVLARPD